MSSNQINTLTSGTINGLNSLALDELTTTSLTAGTMDGDLFYIDRIEANEVIVDTQLRLTSTGVFSVGAVTISDIELTYLDGVSSNIQTQINNINTNTSGLATTVATHTTQIAALEASDTSQNTTLATHTSQISALQTSDSSQNTTLATHTSQISAIETVNATQTSDINSLNFTVTGLSSTVTSLGTDVSILNTKTQNITANSTSTSMSKPLYINSNGQSNTSSLELVDSFSSNKTSFYPNIIAGSFNPIISSGDQAIVARGTIDTETLNLTTHSSVSSGVRIAPSSVVMGVGGTTSTPTNRITCDTGAVNINGTLNLDCGNAKITTAGNMTVGVINSNASGENIRMTGNHNYITAFDSTALTRDFYIGTPNNGDKTLRIVNEKTGVLYLSSGTDGIENNPGRNKIQTYSKGIQFYRGGSTIDYGGEIGLTAGGGDKTLWIKSNLTDDIVIRSGTGNIYLDCPDLRVGAATEPYTKISFMDNGQWVPQISPFTETLKTQITTNKNDIATINTEITALENRFWSQTAIGRVEITTGNVNILGRSTTLSPSTNYPTTTKLYDMGTRLWNNGFSSYFNSNGQWIYNGGAKQRVCFQFDVTFNSGATGIKAFVLRLLQNTSAGTAITQSRPQGVRYSAGGGNPLNSVLYVSTGQFVIDIENLNKVTLECENFFSTSSDGASVTTTGRLTFYLLPY